MYKIFIIILVIIIGFSSCRPSYMRCPKNKRCVALPLQKNSPSITQVNITPNKLKAA